MSAYASLAAATATALALFWLAAWLARPRETGHLSGRRTGLANPGTHHWAGTLPVLGGNEPPTHAWSRFHPRYYPMTLLFIAFEMEMMFMYPWAVVYRRVGTKALMEMGMFLGILSLGILYAWREGAFAWQ